MKKIIFISPLAKENQRTASALRIPQISLYYLAALTPENRYEIKTIDEEYADINLEEDCDLVGISIMTANANRGYYLADEFKKRGKTVVIGGIHATTLPEEALRHADAVCVGEAETSWQRMLDDYEQNQLQGLYNGGYPDLAQPCIAPQPRLDLSPRSMWNVKGLVCTRGCPYNCNFCCVHKFYGRKLRHVPAKTIAKTMDQYDTKYWMFLDDNVLGSPKYAEELFNEITPLKKTWLSQASISFLQNTELINKMAKSGCGGMFFGLENVTVKHRENFKKNAKYLPFLEDSIKRVRDLGIIFHASLVFGFDDDTEETFEETLEWLIRNKIPSVSFNILTPYPGTEIYTQLKAENRILTEDWSHFDHTKVVYQPKQFTPDELMERYVKVRNDFYSYTSMLKRIPYSPNPIFSLLMNMAYHFSVKKEWKQMKKSMLQMPINNFAD